MRNKREKQQRLHWHSIYYHQCEFMRAYTSKHCAHLSKCETETVIKKNIYIAVYLVTLNTYLNMLNMHKHSSIYGCKEENTEELCVR